MKVAAGVVDFLCTCNIDIDHVIDSYNVGDFSQRVVDLAHLVANKWPGTPQAGSGDPLEDFCETNPSDEECKVFE